MSQIASFYLIKNNQRQELSDGNCIWRGLYGYLGLVRVRAGSRCPFSCSQTEDTLDCALLEGELASKVLAALREHNLPQLAAKIAPDWDLPTEAVQGGLETLRFHLELVQDEAALLYEMI